MAKPKAAAKKKEVKVADPPVFLWQAPPPPLAEPVPYSNNLKLEIKQQYVLKPEGKDDKPREVYIKVYEADRDPWKTKESTDVKDLAGVLEIKGSFDAAGKFVPSESKSLITKEHRLTAEVRLLDLDGKALDLKAKDADGKDTPKLEIMMPDPDALDDTWEMDLCWWSGETKEKKNYETWLDRIRVKLPLIRDLLKNPAKYVSKLGDCEPYVKKSKPNIRALTESYKFFYIHCTAAIAAPSIENWMTFKYLDETWKGLTPTVGAHFTIDRAGNIYDCVEGYRVAKHAGKTDLTFKGESANFYALGVELSGCIDDISVSTMYAKRLLETRKSPPAAGGGPMAASVDKLKKINAFICRKRDRTKGKIDRMIDAMKPLFSDVAMAKLTEMPWIPENVPSSSDLLSYADVPDLMDQVMRLVYCEGLAGASVGSSIDLTIVSAKRVEVDAKKLNIIKKVQIRKESDGKADYVEDTNPTGVAVVGTKKVGGAAYYIVELKGARRLVTQSSDFVRVTEGKAKCTDAKGVDLDTPEKITLARLKKDEEVNVKMSADGKSWIALVPEADARQFNKDAVQELLKVERDFKITGFKKVPTLKVIDDTDENTIKEICGTYTDEQYTALADLTQALHKLYQFRFVVTHHRTISSRKRDPGGFFEWDKLTKHPHVADMKSLAKDFETKPKNTAERENGGMWPA